MSEREGRTCERHNQWCPDGVCRYCPDDPLRVIYLPPLSDAAQSAVADFGRRMSETICRGLGSRPTAAEQFARALLKVASE